MKNKKGEPLTDIACDGCGRGQRLRKRKMIQGDGYPYGFLGDCQQNSQVVLPVVPEGWVRHFIPNAAGAFSGYNSRFATPEEIGAIARARDILERGKQQL